MIVWLAQSVDPIQRDIIALLLVSQMQGSCHSCILAHPPPFTCFQRHTTCLYIYIYIYISILLKLNYFLILLKNIDNNINDNCLEIWIAL